MGSTKGNVFDQYRCVEVYDALDDGNNQLAVKKAEALLRDGPFPLASALKTVALFRLGLRKECEEEANRLMSGKVDMNVLLPLQLVFPRIGRAQQLADLYIAASSAHPDDEELADGAVLVLIKAHMFQRALQLILKRFKENKVQRDFWRYIQVSILHSQRLKPPGSKLALEVAHRLLKEQDLKPSEFTEETLHLYLSFFLLQGQDRKKEALKVVTEPHPRELIEKSLGLQLLLREYWGSLDDKESILKDCRTRLMNGDRNWAVISLFVKTVADMTNGSMNTNDVEFMVQVAEKDKWMDRGSFLGVLELFRLAPSSEHHCICKKSVNELVLSYIEQFGEKASCFEDLQPYLKLLDAATKEAIDQAQRSCSSLDNEGSVVKCINLEKMCLALQTSQGKSETKVCRLLEEYTFALKNVPLPATEMQVGDDLALMATIITASSKEGEAFERAALIASFGTQQSEHGYKLRFLLIRLLLRLGCLKMAVNHYNSLGLKSVQLDTVSHYLLDRNASFGGSHSAEIANEWDSNIQHFYEISIQEIPEALGRAFVNGKFSQISDLCEFQDCLDKSCFKLLLEIDMIRAKLINQDLIGSERTMAMDTIQKVMQVVQTADVSDQRDHLLLRSVSEDQRDLVSSVISCGPLRKKNWILAMLEVMSVYLEIQSPENAADLEELTIAETALVELARSIKSGNQISKAAIDFFSKIDSDVKQAKTHFDVLHAAWIGVEGAQILEYVLEVKGENYKENLQNCKETLQSILTYLESSLQNTKCSITSIPELEGNEDFAGHFNELSNDIVKSRTDSLKDVIRSYQPLLRLL